MIVGHGIDILEKERFKNLFYKYPSRITNKYFLYDEINSKDPSLLCNNFSSKEAFSKALGLGFRYPCYPNLISVKRDNKGKPIIKLQKTLNEYVMEKYQNYVIHLSISDTNHLCISSVIIEKI